MTASPVRRQPFRRLRLLLLALAVVVLVGVGTLYLVGRRAQPPLRPVAGEDPLAAADDALAFSEGFEFEQRIGERSAFRLSGDRFVRGRDETITLEGVAVELTREDGSSYRIESRDATWNPGNREAHLTGAVRLIGPRDFQLVSEQLDLVDGGRRVVSRGPVQLSLGAHFGGRATGLRFDTQAERLHLQGRVRLAGTLGDAGGRLSIEAASLLLDRPARKVRASGRVELDASGDRLRTEWLEVTFDAAEREPVSALARGGVSGGLAARGDAAAGGQRVRYEAARARLDFAGAPARPAALELSGADGVPARLHMPGAAGVSRSLVAPTLLASFDEGGRPVAAAATGGVVMRELGAPGGRREARGTEAKAGFDGRGELQQITLTGEVSLSQGDTTASGARAEFVAGSSTGTLFGAGGRPAEVHTARGTLRAPRLELDQRTGKVSATGGVHGVLDDTGSGVQIGPASSGVREPIRIQARQASWDDSRSAWSFSGEVQAVQGETLLFADELTGSETERTATASGSVRTIWREPATPGLPQPQPTTVSASRLDYRQEPGELNYEGTVVARQGDRELAADRVHVELDQDNQARRLEATGEVRLMERPSGRTITGERAEHDFEARRILVMGEPVTLLEPGGAQVRGRRLLYDVAAGTARMLADEEEVP